MTQHPRSLVFGPAATAFLDGLPATAVRVRLAREARSLTVDPHPPGWRSLVVQSVDRPLEGLDIGRIYIGDHRILYAVDGDDVIVIDIRERKGLAWENASPYSSSDVQS